MTVFGMKITLILILACIGLYNTLQAIRREYNVIMSFLCELYDNNEITDIDWDELDALIFPTTATQLALRVLIMQKKLAITKGSFFSIKAIKVKQPDCFDAYRGNPEN